MTSFEAMMSAEVRAMYRAIKGLLTPRELERAIKSGQMDALLNELLSDSNLDPTVERIRKFVATEALRPSMKFMGVGDIARSAPHVERVRALDFVVTEGVKRDIRDSVLKRVQGGLRANQSPAEIARAIRQTVGLHPHQVRWSENYRAKLEKQGRPKEQVARMQAAYEKRLMTNNANTVARSLAHDAAVMGEHLRWQARIDKGLVEAKNVRVRWMAVKGPEGDGRNRPHHLAMHGSVRKWHERYSNGQAFPGEGDWNCRCREQHYTVGR